MGRAWSLAPRSIAFALVLACSALGCDVYSPDALHWTAVCGDGKVSEGELCDTAVGDGNAGACPERCAGEDACLPEYLAGSGCHTRCIVIPVTEPRDGDRCCPEGANAESDSDCGMCGDSIVQGLETCDPPATCASSCQAPALCASAKLVGDAAMCTAKCEYDLILSCIDGDGCCAQGCSPQQDDDCSGECGDGRVNPALGETCEPTNAKAQCPRSCDDGDACTGDLSSGSPGACNVRCIHAPITSSIDDDLCCPPGANGATDNDCPARCGNGVVEPTEMCDGGAFCAPDCSWQNGLLHRYSFDGVGANAVDSVGEAHGVIVNTELGESGRVELMGGTSDQFVSLPAGLIRQLQSATIEVWFTWQGGALYQRIFDFGNNDNGQGNQGGRATSFWTLMVSCSQGNVCGRMNFTAAAADTTLDNAVDSETAITAGALTHVAVVFDEDADRYSVYLDGQPLLTRSDVLGHLSEIDDSNVWIGRSNYNDEEFAGSFDEVRIYGRALSDAAIAASFAAGPSGPQATQSTP